MQHSIAICRDWVAKHKALQQQQQQQQQQAKSHHLCTGTSLYPKRNNCLAQIRTFKSHRCSSSTAIYQRWVAQEQVAVMQQFQFTSYLNSFRLAQRPSRRSRNNKVTCFDAWESQHMDQEQLAFITSTSTSTSTLLKTSPSKTCYFSPSGRCQVRNMPNRLNDFLGNV